MAESPTLLLLLVGLPPSPSSLRVRFWRRLRSLGAVALKRSAYLLPDTPDRHEDFQWLAQEIQREGGEATLIRIQQIENLAAADIVRLFHEPRDADYKRLAADLPDKAVSVRKAEAGESIQQLASVAEASAGERGVDNITLNMVIRRIARAQKKAGDLDRAEATLDRMVETFRRKQLKPQMLRRITVQAEAEKASLGLGGHSGEGNSNGRRSKRKH